MSRTRLAWAAVGLVAIVSFAACGGDADEPLVETPPEPSPEAVADTPAEDPPPADATCEPEPPTSLSDDWQVQSAAAGGFSFARPAEWEDLSGVVSLEAATLIAAETYAETGLGPDERVEADFVRAPSGFPNFSVVRLDGVDSPAEVVSEREGARYATEVAEVQEILTAGIPACIAGEAAAGLDFLFDAGGGSLVYQHNLYVTREGALFILQLLGEDPAADGQLLEEVVRTWQWS